MTDSFKLSVMFSLINTLLGKKSKRPARTLALYGPRNDNLDLLAGLDWILKWAKELGLPEAEWVTWNYGGPGNRQYKSYKMEAWNKRGRPLPDPICTSVSTGRFVEGSKQGRADDIWYAAFDTEPQLTFSVDTTAADLSDDLFVNLIMDAQHIGCFDYGYVFHVPMEKSPSTYERGLLYGTPSTGLSVASRTII